MKPIIAVLPNIKDDGTVSLSHAYIHAIEDAGGIPFICPYTERGDSLNKYIELADGMLITGGADISPSFYGKPTDEPISRRDAYELNLLGAALENGIPVLAICRGLQLLNVYFGGTLIEDIPTFYKSDVTHRHYNGQGDVTHEVGVVAGTPLSSITGEAKLTVNSFHHQAIEKIGEGLLPMAYADDGIIEAVFAPAMGYVMGYQWHPERLADKCAFNQAIFKDFIRECEK